MPADAESNHSYTGLSPFHLRSLKTVLEQTHCEIRDLFYSAACGDTIKTARQAAFKTRPIALCKCIPPSLSVRLLPDSPPRGYTYILVWTAVSASDENYFTLQRRMHNGIRLPYVYRRRSILLLCFLPDIGSRSPRSGRPSNVYQRSWHLRSDLIYPSPNY